MLSVLLTDEPGKQRKPDGQRKSTGTKILLALVAWNV
jgi:hypothetical protein